MSSPPAGTTGLRMHPNYRELLQCARESHERNRSPVGIERRHVQLARLYSYAFRLHAIGAFHGVGQAWRAAPTGNSVAAAWRLRGLEMLEDLANQSMEPVPDDFRAVMITFYRYHRGLERVLDSFDRELNISASADLLSLAGEFRRFMEAITGECGIHVASDREAHELASFLVPNLGIRIVPLVYGDHHSWNLAYLAGQHRDVPTHRHHDGVEIHLGYPPTHGWTILGSSRAWVDEGYAMPIPPRTAHGWVNGSGEEHHVPFIFGSLRHGGWGVFLDVEPQSRPLEELRVTDRDRGEFCQMVYLEREIERARRTGSNFRKTLIPFSVTHRNGSGGLELSLTRILPTGFDYPRETFRILAVVRGEAVVVVEGIERSVREHDHFGIPAGMTARMRQVGPEPLVVLDALIKGFSTALFSAAVESIGSRR